MFTGSNSDCVIYLIVSSLCFVILWVCESEKVMFPTDVAAFANECCDWIGVFLD